MVDSPLPLSHEDYALIKRLEKFIFNNVGGEPFFIRDMPKQIRDVIDFVIEKERTGRKNIKDLEKTEKTYIGTRIEIFVRNYLKLPRDNHGPLDVIVDGISVDIKNTIGNNWMIPHEAEGHPCFLIREDDQNGTCSFGIFIAKIKYLTEGKNQDKKRSISKFGKQNIHWLIKDKSF